VATLVVSEAESILRSIFGDDRAAHRPAQYQILLLSGDPRDGASELPNGGGYARVTVNNDDVFWNNLSGGALVSDPITFNATGPWLAEATHWAAAAPSAPSVLLFSGRLADSIEVTGAGAGPRIKLAVTVPLLASYLE
jgi:hypothetical protein